MLVRFRPRRDQMTRKFVTSSSPASPLLPFVSSTQPWPAWARGTVACGLAQPMRVVGLCAAVHMYVWQGHACRPRDLCTSARPAAGWR